MAQRRPSQSAVSKQRTSNNTIHSPDTAEYRLMREYMDALEYSYRRFRPTLDILTKLNNAYENVLNEQLFPTWSKVAIPNHFAFVQEALPSALDLIWPDSQNTYTLIPVDPDADAEAVDRVEWALNFMVRERMKAKWATLPTITNALKTGLGYAAVTPYNVTPLAATNTRILRNGREVSARRGLGIGRKQKTVMLENVGLGEIVVSDDGTDFNGHDSVSYAFRFKFYSEKAFRRLLSNLQLDAEDVDVEGNADKIIEEARNFGFYSEVPIESLVRELGGISIGDRNNWGGDKIGVVIPVIQCFGEQEHVWIANGTTVIHHVKDEVETLYRPLVKASVTVDSGKWHPMNPAEAGQAIASGQNLYYNMLMDFVWRALNPYMVYNVDKFGGKPPVVGRNGEIAVHGPITDSMDFPQSPTLQQGHLAMESLLTRLYARSTGHPDQMQQPTPGMVRGGLHALESLLNTTAGRNRLAGMIVEMGFVQPIGLLTLIDMQLMADGEGMTFTEREYDNESGKSRIERRTVTIDDLNHAYEVSVDTRGRFRGVTDLNERLQMWNGVYRDNPLVDQYDALTETIGDVYKAKKLLPSRERAREIQDERVRQQREERQLAGGPAGGTAEAIEEGALAR